MKELNIAVLILVIQTAVSSPFGEFVVRVPRESKDNEKETITPRDTVIYEMDIYSNISNRFAKTLVTSKVKNSNSDSQETTFTVVLPDKAFISEFILKMNDKEYKAYVKEKAEAKQIYEAARAQGQTAGHVAVSARDSNTFTISVNVEPEAKAAFLLTYEELLERKNNQYELILNIHPGQVVEKLDVKVLINESRPLRFVTTPSIRSGNEINKNEGDSNELSKIELIQEKTAVVEFHPDKEQQMELAKKFGKKESNGLAGQFVVQYDVQHDQNGGEILLQDGFFVHFFAPDNLDPLSKHIVFVLDTSGSMNGPRITQLKEAMNNILNQLQPGDQVSLIEFNSHAIIWDIANGQDRQVVFRDYEDPFGNIEQLELPLPALITNNETITKVKNVVNKLSTSGYTNMIDGLYTALAVIKNHINQKEQHLQPIIMFLTDGEPVSGGMFNTKDKIQKMVTKINSKNNKVPVYSLSFGEGVDKGFLRKLSLQNYGFSKHIYEGSDASIQLENFYKEISVPLLSNVTFEYVDAANFTKKRQPIFFRGNEIAISGTYDSLSENALKESRIRGLGINGYVSLVPSVEKPVSSLERLWAYLTVKNKLEKVDSVKKDAVKNELKKEALEIALKYSFVTDVTSLVVVKPNDTSSSDPLQSISSQQPEIASLSAATHPFQYSAKPPTLHSNMSPHVAFSSQPRTYMSSIASYGPPAPSLHRPVYSDRSTNNILHSRTVNFLRPIPTTTVASTTTTTFSLSNLKKDLPWLESVLLSNGTLNINDNNFLLEGGVSYRFTDCPKTPVNGTESGMCSLLKDCSEVFSYLTDFQVYKQYFCIISNSYAGVCCPRKKTGDNILKF